MRGFVVILAVVCCCLGCQRFTIRTQNRVAVDGPVETRLTGSVETRVVTDLPPVSTTAGPVRAIVVQMGASASASRVAIVDVDGLLLNSPFVGPLSVGENPVALFREKLDAIEADRNAVAVVLRINSPGGGVAACAAMRRDLKRFQERTKLPVVACLMDLGTGGAYHLASAADQVVADPACITGGIGVLLNLYNLKELMAQFNVASQLIKAGELVDIGSCGRPLKPAEKELLQAMADEFHKQLQADIKKARPKLDDAQETTFDGRIFTGTQAVTRGLVDRTGDLDDAIRIAAQLGCPGATPTRPAVVLYRRTNDPATTVYAVTANIPLQGTGLLPSLPGFDRSKLPTFLSVWQPELTLEKLGGK